MAALTAQVGREKEADCLTLTEFQLGETEKVVELGVAQ